jgi:hypothetical protein
MTFETWVREQGYTLVLTDRWIDQIISEEGSSHLDGSEHEYEVALTLNGLTEKCLFCGKEKTSSRSHLTHQG